MECRPECEESERECVGVSPAVQTWALPLSECAIITVRREGFRGEIDFLFLVVLNSGRVYNISRFCGLSGRAVVMYKRQGWKGREGCR